MSTFRAYRIDRQDDGITAGFQQMSIDDLTEGNVVIKVSHSTINYKDALAATGTAPILRRYPLNGGIDLAGVVESSDDAGLPPGTAVLVNGAGLGETVDGGYAGYARVDSASVVPIPDGMTAVEAMQIGTAGYTAFLFGQCEGRDLWQSTMLPLHLIVQAAMAGTALMLVMAASSVEIRNLLAGTPMPT